jgi:hypothetical protein
MTTVYTEYATLGNYLHNQQYKIPSTVTTPSMQTPIIPQYSGGYGLSTLTHDYDGVGYYNINKAYACSQIETSFNISQCPSNQPLATFGIKENFKTFPPRQGPQPSYLQKKSPTMNRNQ